MIKFSRVSSAIKTSFIRERMMIKILWVSTPRLICSVKNKDTKLQYQNHTEKFLTLHCRFAIVQVLTTSVIWMFSFTWLSVTSTLADLFKKVDWVQFCLFLSLAERLPLTNSCNWLPLIIRITGFSTDVIWGKYEMIRNQVISYSTFLS